MLADQEFVAATLRPYEAALFDAVHEGWKDWQKLELGPHLQFVRRSRACLVYDFSVQHLQTMLAGVQGVHAVVGDETVKFVFKGSVVLRVKKANERGLGSNIATQANFAFVGGQMDLPGFQNVQPVEVLYELNDLQTKIAKVLVSARDGNRCLWSYPITGGRGAAVVPVVTPVQPSGGGRGAKVKLRAVDSSTTREGGT